MQTAVGTIEQRRRAAVTVRRHVGPKFRKHITADPTTSPAVVAALRMYSQRERLDGCFPSLLETLTQRLVREGRPRREAYVQTLCRTYTMDEWPFAHVNRALRHGIRPMLQPLAPHIRALIGICNPALQGGPPTCGCTAAPRSRRTGSRGMDRARGSADWVFLAFLAPNHFQELCSHNSNIYHAGCLHMTYYL